MAQEDSGQISTAGWEAINAATVALCALSDASLKAMLDNVRAERGLYPIPGSKLQIEVRPTLLRDGQGGVIREIG